LKILGPRFGTQGLLCRFLKEVFSFSVVTVYVAFQKMLANDKIREEMSEPTEGKMTGLKKYYIILLAIMAVGIFLRVYDFHDWLGFGPEQARDAKLISNVIENNGPMPLLGPKAGDTLFRVGPIFYYFQYFSARIFGVSPTAMAYPDLFFSILTIPLLFLLLKKYFSSAISLWLTALYSVSYMAVQNSRFAWNPNSVSFFTILFFYAFLRLVDSKSKHKYLWAAVAGLAMGVGVQLHTTYLLIIPLACLIFSAYAIKRRMMNWKMLAAIFCVAMVLNIPQAVSEYHSRWQNTQAFINGVFIKPPKGAKTISGSIGSGIAWQAQSNTMFLTSYGNDDNPDYMVLGQKIKNHGLKNLRSYGAVFARFILTAMLAIIGYGLLGYFIKREHDREKKNFLILLAIHASVAFLALVAIAHNQGLVVRYFLIIEFIPFVLLGFLVKFSYEKYGKRALTFMLAVILLLGLENVSALQNYFQDMRANGANSQTTTLAEEEAISKYIIANTNQGQRVYFVDDANEGIMYKNIIAPLYYFMDSANIQISKNYITNGDISNAVADSAYFALVVNNGQAGGNFSKTELQNFNVIGSKQVGFLSVLKLESK
jgi:uncharacterized membrane protein